MDLANVNFGWNCKAVRSEIIEKMHNFKTDTLGTLNNMYYNRASMLTDNVDK